MYGFNIGENEFAIFIIVNAYKYNLTIHYSRDSSKQPFFNKMT